jgi:hypothetical protein
LQFASQGKSFDYSKKRSYMMKRKMFSRITAVFVLMLTMLVVAAATAHAADIEVRITPSEANPNSELAVEFFFMGDASDELSEIAFMLRYEGALILRAENAIQLGSGWGFNAASNNNASVAGDALRNVTIGLERDVTAVGFAPGGRIANVRFTVQDLDIGDTIDIRAIVINPVSPGMTFNGIPTPQGAPTLMGADGLVATIDVVEPSIPATGLTVVTGAPATMVAGDTANVEVSVVPDDADTTGYTIVWASSAAGVATVPAGTGLQLTNTITAVAAGTANITAQLVNAAGDNVGAPVTFAVTVTAAPAPQLAVSVASVAGIQGRRNVTITLDNTGPAQSGYLLVFAGGEGNPVQPTVTTFAFSVGANATQNITTNMHVAPGTQVVAIAFPGQTAAGLMGLTAMDLLAAAHRGSATIN